MFAKYKTEVLTSEDVAKLDFLVECPAGVVRFTNRKGNILYVVVTEAENSYNLHGVGFRLYDKDCKLLERTYVGVNSISSYSSFDNPQKKAKLTILFQAGLKLPSDAVGKKFYRKAVWRVAAYMRKMARLDKKLEKKRKALALKEARENSPAFQAIKKFFDR